MGLHDDGLVIIEAGLNETAGKDRNPNVPYGPDEVVPAGIAAARAGAAVLHFHARRADGSQHWTGHELYREAIEGITAEVDVLCYPSYVEANLSHVMALSDVLAFAPFDVVQHVRRVQWDHARQQLASVTVLGGPLRPPYPPELDEFAAAGMLPTIAAFEMGELRWAVLAARSGVIPQPLSLKVFLNDSWIKGPFADVTGLEAFLSQVPDDVDLELMAVPYEMQDRARTEELLLAALDRGMHIRVGIGDNPSAFPSQTTADLVEWAVELAASRGLAPATPQDVRRRYGIAG